MPEKNNTQQNTRTWWETDERLDHSGQAAFLGIKPQSLSAAISRGEYKYPRYKVGKKQWARKAEIVKYIEEERRVA